MQIKYRTLLLSQNIVYDLTHETSLPDLEFLVNPNLNQNKAMPNIQLCRLAMAPLPNKYYLNKVTLIGNKMP